ncbi:Hypothetical protein, putative [Bodo saltans]|uniref:Uncharacterized protein n=1 Tax=Bodo saltans TaxID=75058 RepID=A0A0S4JKU3_BODSA|nr:Hypothetical protein, putative [Bodo saltans]|eukprot:CUG90746.1 Hypothetical protein, putative [Bodo saltans]
MIRISNSVCVVSVMARHRSFKATIDLHQPENSKAVVEETLSALRASGSTGSTRFLHGLINLAMCHYHLGEFAEAHKVAAMAHTAVLTAQGPSSSLVYFSATTAEKCCVALAASFELHRSEKAATSSNSSALEPSAAKSLRSEAMLTRLATDAREYRKLAQNVLAHPNNVFMRSPPRAGFDDSQSESDHPKNGAAEHHHHRQSISRRSLRTVPK